MPELIKKFFSEDLTEAEQQTLSEMLLNSDEAALDFEKAAKEAYERYGFPEPKPNWNKPPETLTPRSNFGLGLGLVFLVSGLTLLVIWKVCPSLSNPSGALGWLDFFNRKTKASLKSHTEEEVPARKKRSVIMAQSNKYYEEDSSSDLERVEVAREEPTQEKSNPGAGSLSENPQVVPSSMEKDRLPVNLNTNPSPSYSNLAIEVNLGHLSFLTVRVLDPQGREIKGLYHGNLSPGNWRFEWDGKLSDGSVPNPGIYKIEVRSGSYIQRKDIQIQ